MLGGKLASHPEGSSDIPNHLMLRKLGEAQAGWAK